MVELKKIQEHLEKNNVPQEDIQEIIESLFPMEDFNKFLESKYNLTPDTAREEIRLWLDSKENEMFEYLNANLPSEITPSKVQEIVAMKMGDIICQYAHSKGYTGDMGELELAIIQWTLMGISL
jgi:hypothetical protein